MIDKDVFEELLESTLGEIEEKTEVDVSENSFTRKINEILLKSNAETMALLKENVKSFSIDNIIDTELDKFYDGYFGIKRQSLSTSDYKKVTILNNYEKDMFIEAGTVFKINSFYFSLMQDSIIEAKSTRVIEVSPDFTIFNRVNITSISNDVSMDFTGENEEFLTYVSALGIESSTLESDASYKARCKKLTQNFGFDNIAKIKSICMGIPELQDLKIEEKEIGMEVVVIPKKIEYIDSLVSYVKEVVGYYRGSKITVSTPSITLIQVDGVGSQIQSQLEGTYQVSNVKTHMENIFEEVNNYIRSVVIEGEDNRTYVPKKVELIINRYISDNSLTVVLNETLIKHYYSVYNRANYQTEMISGKITRAENKKIISDVAMLSKIS